MFSLITIAPTFVCLFWAGVFGVEYIRSTPERKAIFWFMTVATLLYAGHYCYFNRLERILPVSDTIYSFANLAVYPLYLLYIHRVTTVKRIQWYQWALLLPALLILVANAAGYAILERDTIRSFIQAFLLKGPMEMGDNTQWLVLTHRLSAILFPLTVIYVFAESFRKIRSFNDKLRYYYSNNEKRSLNPIIRLQILLLCCSLASIAINTLGKSFFAGHQMILAIPSMLFSTLLFAIGYEAYTRQFTATVFAADNAPEPPTDNKQKNSSIQELAERITHLLHTQQLYLNPDLKINDLATLLCTNRNYVYQAITDQLGTNFSDMVNHQRIDHAQKLMQQSPSLSNAEIANQSGYNSESSFYRNFKAITGITPAQYRKLNH